jgi:hypothetical protein
MQSNYSFKHLFVNEDKVEFEVSITTASERGYEIVNDFVAFLRGCQFCDSAIKDALEAAADELNMSKK